MLVLEREGQKGNSLSFNPVNDDPRCLGYKALLYCITMPEREYDKNHNKIMRALHNGSVESEDYKKKKEDKIIVIDTVTGKKKKFDRYSEAAKYAGVSTTTINKAICRENIVAKKWRFRLERVANGTK